MVKTMNFFEQITRFLSAISSQKRANHSHHSLLKSNPERIALVAPFKEQRERFALITLL